MIRQQYTLLVHSCVDKGDTDVWDAYHSDDVNRFRAHRGGALEFHVETDAGEYIAELALYGKLWREGIPNNDQLIYFVCGEVLVRKEWID